MRMFARDAAFYRRVRVDETNDAEALRHLKELEAVDRSGSAVGAWGWPEHVLRAQASAARGGRDPRSSRPKSHPGRQWTMAGAKRRRDFTGAH